MNYLKMTLLLFIVLCSLSILSVVYSQRVGAFEQISVGMTYYGGHYDERKHHWVVDNAYQCDRMKSGEYSIASLNAKMSDRCDDDPGYGYFDYIPLHNTVSYAELSINFRQNDFSALGNLPARTKLQIEYAGKCIVAEKLDVGGGGPAVYGYQRSIDLWWETARSLGFTNGFDIARISYISQDVPLTPLGQTSKCIVPAKMAAEPENLLEEQDPVPNKSEKNLEREIIPTVETQDLNQDSVKGGNYSPAVIIIGAGMLVVSLMCLVAYVFSSKLTRKK